MASASINDSQLRIMLDYGQDQEGKPVVKSKTFNNVKTSSTVEQLYNIASALTPLQKHAVILVERNDSYTIKPA